VFDIRDLTLIICHSTFAIRNRHDRVITARAERLATQQAPEALAHAPQDTILGNRLEHVF
jgi:hypothetical protein